MPDPSNPDDVPEILRQPYPGHPKSPAYRREVKRQIKNRRRVKVVDMAEVLMGGWRAAGVDDAWILAYLPDLRHVPDRWWRDLAATAGHPSSKPPSPKTREAVIKKVREDLAREAT